MAFSARRVTIVLALLFGVATLLVLQTVARGQSSEAPPGEAVEVEDGETYAAERLIVTYEPDASEAAESEAVEEVEGEVEEEIEAVDAEVVEVPAAEEASPGEDRKDALERAREDLQSEPGVESVEYDYLRESTYVPNDARFPEQWGLKKPGFPASWGSNRGDDGAGVRIAVVDSGIDARHPDLSGKVALQRDFVDGDGVAQDGGGTGHGTHVSGIAAAVTGNGAGISGACPDCRLVVARSMRGGTGYDSDIAAGVTWAADNGARVINLSLGGPAPSTPLRRAVNYAWNKGAVVVAAAGNTGNGAVQYPAAFPNVIGVAASDQSDRRASFSTYGDWVDVSAPGVGITSTVPGGYSSYSGTSMASPHVAALAGLLISRGLTNEQARSRIVSSATDAGTPGQDPYHGAGRIDAARTLGAPRSPQRAQQVRVAAAPAPSPAPPAPDPGQNEDGDRRLFAVQQTPEDQPAPPNEAEQAVEAPPQPTSEAEVAVAEPAVAEPADTQPAVAEPVDAKPVNTKPAVAEPVAAEPVDARPASPQPADAQPVNSAPVDAQPAEAQPVAANSVDAKSVDTRPAGVEPTGAEPTAAWTMGGYLSGRGTSEEQEPPRQENEDQQSDAEQAFVMPAAKEEESPEDTPTAAPPREDEDPDVSIVAIPASSTSPLDAFETAVGGGAGLLLLAFLLAPRLYGKGGFRARRPR